MSLQMNYDLFKNVMYKLLLLPIGAWNHLIVYKWINSVE